MIRIALIAAVFLASAGLAAAQTRTGDVTRAVEAAQPQQLRRIPVGRISTAGIHQPRLTSITLACDQRQLVLTVEEGSCHTFSNTGPDGDQLPPIYAWCTNAAGDRANAGCYQGGTCYQSTGSGQCRVA